MGPSLFLTILLSPLASAATSGEDAADGGWGRAYSAALTWTVIVEPSRASRRILILVLVSVILTRASGFDSS
jgi:hypothetical protein